MQRHHTSVPTVKEVVPGAAVDIVLKQDQPTGRTVSGTVRDVLTRGNHPRGIKVRLADGRVGRVQSIASGDVKAPVGETDQAQPELQGSVSPARAGEDVRALRGRIGRGPRTAAGEEEVPTQQIGLDAYIKPAKAKRKRRGDAVGGAGTGRGGLAGQVSSDSAGAQQAELVRCPVCDEFEGDEAAVAHHVAGHFDA